MEPFSRRIYIDPYDLERLRMLLRTQGDLSEPHQASLRTLAADLEHAVVVSDGQAVPKVITMNSRFRLKDLDAHKTTTLKLTFPGKPSKGLGKLSVLTPEGAALLGTPEGHTVSVITPEGIKRLRVEAILFQPEASRLVRA